MSKRSCFLAWSESFSVILRDALSDQQRALLAQPQPSSSHPHFPFAPSPGGPELQRAGRPGGFLRRQQPVRELGEHDHHLLHQGVLLRQAGGREGGGEHGRKVFLFAGVNQSFICTSKFMQ